MYSDFNYTTTFGKKKRNKDNTGPDMKDLEVAPVPEAPKPKTPPKKGDQSGTYAAPSNEVSGPKTAEWAKKFGGSEGLNQKADAAANIGRILSSGQMKSLPSTDPVRVGSSTNTVPGEEISDYDKWVATEKKKKKKNNNYD